MDGSESKKLALLRTLTILQNESDEQHPLKQEDIVALLDRDYGITVERKTVGRNLALLKEAGYDIVSVKNGSYLAERLFEDSELRLLIDGVLASVHISERHSKDIINKLCSLSNRYFRAHNRHIHSAGQWNRTENQSIFYSIEVICQAIEDNVQVQYDYNKFGIDKKLHKTSTQYITPYQLIMHNQRYYLFGYSEYWDHVVLHRLDRITGIRATQQHAISITNVKGYEHGVDYRRFSACLPYMYTDKPEYVTFTCKAPVIDQVIDWFGKDIRIERLDDESLSVTVLVSPDAMVYWALQYADNITVTAPQDVAGRIKAILATAVKNYG